MTMSSVFATVDSESMEPIKFMADLTSAFSQRGIADWTASLTIARLGETDLKTGRAFAPTSTTLA